MKPEAVMKAAANAEEAHAAAYPKAPEEKPKDEPTPKEKTADEPTPKDITNLNDALDKAEADSGLRSKEETVDYWKQKYNTLQGMYNKDVPRLNAEISSLVGEKQNLETLLSAKPTAAPAPAPEKLITEQEAEDFGPDMVEFAKKAAMEALGPELNQLRERNAVLEGQLNDQQRQVGTIQADAIRDQRQVVFDELSNAVPNWVQINESDSFINWLAEMDVFTGETKQALVNKAFESNDAKRVVAFFLKYVDETNLVSGQRGNQQTDTLSPTVNMENLVAPGRPQASASAAPSLEEKPMWAAQDISDFYSRVQRGEYKNNPEEKHRIEADIVAAGAEGRIQQ